MSGHPPRGPVDRRAPRRAQRAVVAWLGSIALIATVSGCADLSRPQPSFGAQPSLTPEVIQPVVPGPGAAPTSSGPSSSPSDPSGTEPPPSGSSAPPQDPCLPSDPAVIAACLDAPWGLALLPGGMSALVGERTTGRILTIAPQTKPVLYATVRGIDASGTGGLLGIALSPSYDEDGLIYAYVTTAKDNRILRIAKGDTPKAILTGIPRGAKNNGGRIQFGRDGQLYIGTGNTGNAKLAADRTSLAGKILRVDGFGKPSKGNPTSGSAVFASGFTDVTGMCSVNGAVAVIDHRTAADLVIAPKAGGAYAAAKPPNTIWTWRAAEGGANDCAQATRQLAFTSLPAQRVVALDTDTDGSFTGAPTALVDKTYGRLLTLELGGAGTEQELFWATTSNKDGQGKPIAADDRVIVIQSSGGGGDGGSD